MPSKDKSIQLIVNADDLGRIKSINDGIEEAFRNGIVSSTSLVANSPDFLDAINMVRRNPMLDVGVHLTLHEYPPIDESKFLQEFTKNSWAAVFWSILFISDDKIKLIKEELRRQIDKVISSGVKPTHLDGHCHVHIHPRLFNIVLELAKENSIRWIRIPKESLFVFSNFPRYVQKIILSSVCFFDVLLMKDKFRFVGNFHGFSNGGNMNQNNLLNILSKMRPGLNELMCHVGSKNDDSPLSIDYKWQDELKAMTTFTKQQLQKEFGIHVISYRELDK